MAGRVLSSQQAKGAITQIQNILSAGFTDQLTALNHQGQILSDPNV